MQIVRVAGGEEEMSARVEVERYKGMASAVGEWPGSGSPQSRGREEEQMTGMWDAEDR